MFRKLLVRSILLGFVAINAVHASIPSGDPSDLPGYQEGQPGNGDQFPGDTSGPQDPANAYNPNPYLPNPYEPNPYQPSPIRPGRPNRPGRPGHGGQAWGQEIKSIYIGRAVFNERLPLREMAGLDQSYQGSEIISVTANAQPNSSQQTVVQLVADGRVIAQQINPGRQIYLVPNQRIILSQNIRSLQLVVMGSTIIGQIDITISNFGNGSYPPAPVVPQPPPYNPSPNYPPYNPPGYGQQQRIDIQINHEMYGNDQLDLNQFVNLWQYRGYTIDQVLISGTSQFEPAFVELLLNNFSVGQVEFSDGYQQEQAMNIQGQPVIGQQGNDLVLQSSGNITINRITLILSR